MLSIFSSTTFSSNLHVCPYRYSELQDWSFVTISPSALFSRGRWYLLVTNFQCRIVCPELEASVNGWWYAKHISYIRVTICLCAAINLRLDVDCSRFALSYPRYCPPPSHTSCCYNSQWPPHRWLSARRGQQKGFGWQPLHLETHMHTHVHTIASTHSFHCLAYNDKCQHTLSWEHQSVSWSMTNCSPRQQTPMQRSWGIFEISHRMTQFHRTHIPSGFLLYPYPFSPASLS